MKLDWVILTNFKETRLYYSHVIEPIDGEIFRLTFDRYITSLDKLRSLSRYSVHDGVLDNYERRRKREDVDKAVLKDLLEFRRKLTQNIIKNNSGLSRADVRDSVQRII